MTVLTVDQFANAGVVFVDRVGNVATVEGVPLWSSSDVSVATVTASEDGFSAMIDTVNVGTCQIIVRGDADLGDGVQEVLGVADVQVVPGQAVAANVVLEAAPKV